MDDELKQLEVELTRLAPAAPSPTLIDRLENELGVAPRGSRRSPMAWFAIALPAAAAVALLVGLSVGRKSTLAPSAVASVEPAGAKTDGGIALKPVAAEQVLISADDEGLVTLEDGTQARRARLQYVDTITWKNPRTNASLTWSVPREEIRVVPIAFQ